MKFALVACVAGLALLGCHSTLKEGGATADAEIRLGNEGLTLKTDDGKGGSANLTVGNAKLVIHDEHGGVQMEAGPNTVKLKAHGDDGSFENGVSVSEGELTVPTYPGSAVIPIASMKVTNKSEGVYVATRTTSDDPKAVIDFYRSELGSGPITSITTNENGHVKLELKGKSKSGRDIAVTAERSEDNKITTIVVASSKKDS